MTQVTTLDTQLRTRGLGTAWTAKNQPPASNTLADLLRMLDGDCEPPEAAERWPVAVRRVRAEDNLVHEGTPVDAIFFVCAGTFKIYRTDEDGYEQVLSFAVRQEVLGFDALCMDAYPTAISALEDSSVYAVLRRDIMPLCQAVPAFGQALQRAGSLTLTRSRELVDIMAAVASEVRLARFLILLSRRMAACGQSPRRFLLRMGRREIASLLGVAHETVSRSFGSLMACGLVHVSDREIEILDLDGLKSYSRSTRRHIDVASAQRLNGRGAARALAPVKAARLAA